MTSITNSIVNRWLERPPSWPSTTPCLPVCPLLSGELAKHIVSGGPAAVTRCTSSVTLALTEVKSERPGL